MLKVSVITVCFNSRPTIEHSIKSVLSQEEVDLQYIVVDGASSDGTLDVLRSFESSLSQLISEPDEGMYDAMNKGIARATGDIVGILNSDDVYASPRVLADVVEHFEETGSASANGSGETGPDVVYGDLNYAAQDDLDKVVRVWKSGEYQVGAFRRGWHPPHPAFFVRRSVYEKLGGFRLDLKIAADYEFMLRVLEKSGYSVAYLPKVLVKMRVGGESNRSLLNILKANMECYQAWRLNGYGFFSALSAVIRKPLGKLAQLRGLPEASV